MPDSIKIVFTSLLVSSFFIPVSTFAQANLLGDGSTGAPDVTCLRLNNILRYGIRNSSVNGEVTKLQSYLKETGYLSGSTTGSFGPNTRSAVKRLQAEILTDVNENDIDSSIVTSAADRHTLAATGFRLSNTGTVGIYTRAKIIYLSCGEIADISSTVGQGAVGNGNQSNLQSTGISNVNSQAGSVTSTVVSSLVTNQMTNTANLIEGPSTCLLPTYDYDLGSSFQKTCDIKLNLPKNAEGLVFKSRVVNSVADNWSPGGSFAGKQMIEYRPGKESIEVAIFSGTTKVSSKIISSVCENNGIKRDDGVCFSQLGLDSNFLEGPSTCVIPTYTAINPQYADNYTDAAEGKCSVTFSWKNSPNGKSRIIYEYDPKNVRASLETSVAGSATIVLDYNSRTATPKLYSSSSKMDIKTFMGVCESGAVKNNIGRCVPASDTSADKCGAQNLFWKGNYDSAYTPNNINHSSQLLCVSSVTTEKVGYTSTITGTNSGKRADIYTINGYGKADVTCKIDSRDGAPKWFIEPTTKKCKATESLIDSGVETVSY